MVVYLSCFVTYAGAVGYSKNIPVNPVKQATNYWCWAACSEMCGRTLVPESTITQYDIAEYISGTPDCADYSGSGYDIINGCKYATLNRRTFDCKENTFALVNERIYKNEPLVGIGLYDPVNAGHAVLITGTVFTDGAEGSGFEVYFIDPGDALTYRYPLNDLKKGEYYGLCITHVIYAV